MRGLAIVFLALAWVPAAQAAAPTGTLQALRGSGDLAGQRRHVWGVFNTLTRASGSNRPALETWWGEDAIFGTRPAARGMAGFARTTPPNPQIADAPVITYTLYNDVAYRHMMANRLNRASELARLRKTGQPDDAIAGNRAIPVFPADAIVLKTAWWPIAPDTVTAMPVWDSQTNAAAPFGNPYIAWQRVVAVNPRAQGQPVMAISFAGRTFPAAPRVSLDRFYHLTLDAALARRLMKDPESVKAALIALGRPLRAGDHLALVAANLATKELPDWIWAAFWWHDRADAGPFAADRPAMASPWRNYLMQAAFDSQTPRAPDGGAHICFNPWLEGRFPDGGHGAGAASNCMSCHRRASYPAVSFLPVTRGAADLRRDAAFAPGRLRTGFLWSIPMHAKP